MSDEHITIGYVSRVNPFEDVKNWSGSTHNLCLAIKNAGFDVVWIPMRPNSIMLHGWSFLMRLLYHGRVHIDHTYFFLKLCARSINVKKLVNCEYIFFPGYSQVIKFLRPVPENVISFSDSSFNQMIGYYWPTPPVWNYRQGIEGERFVNMNSKIIIKSSKWAADFVSQDTGGLREANILLFGANVTMSSSIRPKQIEYRNRTLNLLFSGVDWVRKGGEVAVDAVRILNEMGFPAKLTIVGIRNLSETISSKPYVRYEGFLDKSSPSDAEKYRHAFESADFFILPTNAECSCIVSSEASAYGVPILITDTGGMADYVINGVNGYRLSPEATGLDYAKKIIAILRNNEYESLSRGGINLYKEKLSWDCWSNGFAHLIKCNQQRSQNV